MTGNLKKTITLGITILALFGLVVVLLTVPFPLSGSRDLDTRDLARTDHAGVSIATASPGHQSLATVPPASGSQPFPSAGSPAEKAASGSALARLPLALGCTALLFLALLLGLWHLKVRVLRRAQADDERDQLRETAREQAAGIERRYQDELQLKVDEHEATRRQLHEVLEQVSQLAQQSGQASAARSRFLASVAQELHAPLQGILASSHQLEGTRLATRQAGYLQHLAACSETLMRTVNDILDFSQLEAGHLGLASEEFSVADLIRGLSDRFQPQAKEKGLKLQVRIDPALPERLLGDPLRLAQVLGHLLSNAVKFTRHGSVSLEATLEQPGADHPGYLLFAVRDTGLGIADREHPLRSSPFEQPDDPSRPSLGESGLGLTISRELSTLMGGEVRGESIPGVGSCFTLQLPLTPADGETPVGESPAPAYRFDGERVLVVEDNQVNRTIMQQVLQGAGLTVTLAVNGAEALALWEEGFDLVLMDSQMPVLDGLSATRHIRGTERAGEPLVPIIAVTANALEHEVQACLAAGADEVLAKPFTPAQLLNRVKYWLGERCLCQASAGRTAAANQHPAALDLVLGIHQIGGSRELYTDLLHRFVEEYRDSADRLRAERERGDVAGAALIAHSVKGVAGVLAAVPLQRAAGCLERALTQGTPELSGYLEHFERELEEVLLEVPKVISKVA
ncbi:hypothetical protein GMLC_23200 [Geomonas limicola]|uniref:histidine kinase n=1 Tax=Geomonas limicola TaxID=2740186 RepID=A0A6V8N8B3_9BACT|nr:response regulator [Geomonas limicola]GFO68741.1 hypothetical protein GMLC_23200 [Geomonas limicola]